MSSSSFLPSLSAADRGVSNDCIRTRMPSNRKPPGVKIDMGAVEQLCPVQETRATGIGLRAVRAARQPMAASQAATVSTANQANAGKLHQPSFSVQYCNGKKTSLLSHQGNDLSISSPTATNAGASFPPIGRDKDTHHTGTPPSLASRKRSGLGIALSTAGSVGCSTNQYQEKEEEAEPNEGNCQRVRSPDATSTTAVEGPLLQCAVPPARRLCMLVTEAARYQRSLYGKDGAPRELLLRAKAQNLPSVLPHPLYWVQSRSTGVSYPGVLLLPPASSPSSASIAYAPGSPKSRGRMFSPSSDPQKNVLATQRFAEDAYMMLTAPALCQLVSDIHLLSSQGMAATDPTTCGDKPSDNPPNVEEAILRGIEEQLRGLSFFSTVNFRV